MRNLIVVGFMIIVTGLMSGCGKTEYNNVLVPTRMAQDFEGLFYCENGSNVELIADYQDRVTFETSGQSLNSINPINSTLSTHPIISNRDVVVNGNKLVMFPVNVTYSSSTHDVEKDAGGDINGKKRTDYSISLNEQDQLLIKITIYDNAINSNINSIIVEREFTCSK